jgi:myo-inositol-1(or 4)-monophosphatase
MKLMYNHSMEKLNELNKIALEAGKIIKDGYAKTFEVSKKSPTELVTEYDKAVEEFLIEKIQPLYSDYTIVAEESFLGGKLPKKAIFIDPIDGTTNFVHKIPHLAISIGVWEDGKAQEAIVYNPILEELYSAKRGQGAFCNGEAISVKKDASLQNAIIATGFPYVKHEMGKEYWWVVKSIEQLLPKIRDIRRLGAAAIDLCYLSSGKVNGFYEINLQPWDVAAGILIVEEAGGEVSGIDGKAYDFNKSIIVASNGSIHKELLNNLADFKEE